MECLKGATKIGTGRFNSRTCNSARTFVNEGGYF